MRFSPEFKERAELIATLADLTAAAMLMGYCSTKLVQWLWEHRPKTV